MSDHPRSMSPHEFYDRAPTSYRTVKFFMATAIGASLLFLSGLTVTGTVIALILATPLLVLFSPILVPAGIAIFLATVGFLFSGGCGLTAITLLSWVCGFVTGKHPPGADQLDYARMKIADKARDMKERAKEYGLYMQHKAQEAAQSY